MPPSFAFRGSNARCPPPYTKNTSTTSRAHIYTPCASMCTPIKKTSLFSPQENPAIFADRQGPMGQFASKAKQGAEQQATQQKDGKVAHKSSDERKLLEFMEENYEKIVKPATTFDEFYHAIHEIIERFCADRGQLQYKIPSKDDLKNQYEKVNPNPKDGKNLSKDDFIKITEHIVTVDSFTFGNAAIDVLMVLFGVPVCALLAKRVIPGLKSFSDDVVIPAATSGAVVYLAKTNKL